MAKSLNRCEFIGNLGKDVETKFLPDGTVVANFSVACGESYKDKQGSQVDKTEWINVVAWRKLAEICDKYLKKGSKVWVEGKLSTRKWQDKSGVDHWTTEIILSNMLMLDGRNSGSGQQSGQTAGSGAPSGATNSAPANTDFDDDIPF